MNFSVKLIIINSRLQFPVRNTVTVDMLHASRSFNDSGEGQTGNNF